MSLGGQLRAASTPGVGSTFEIVLPPAAPTASADARNAASDPVEAAAPMRLGRVLVVDDEVALLRAITEILELDGLTVTSTSKPREALAMIAGGERFDVILSDISMPDMTGINFYEAIRAQDEGLAQRMIFMSGGAVTEQADNFLKGLANQYVVKPFKSADLRRSIQRALAAQ
jgi:CheY-like chemotaxis protein